MSKYIVTSWNNSIGIDIQFLLQRLKDFDGHVTVEMKEEKVFLQVEPTKEEEIITVSPGSVPRPPGRASDRLLKYFQDHIGAMLTYDDISKSHPDIYPREYIQVIVCDLRKQGHDFDNVRGIGYLYKGTR